MKIHLTTLGCRLNEAELETWSRQFAAAGHPVTLQAEEADVVVVNTCAVTEEAVRKSRKLLRRIHRANPGAQLVVSGCFSSLDPNAAQQLPGIDLLVANQDKGRLVELVSRHLHVPVDLQHPSDTDAQLLFGRGRQRAFIKVQDGCRYRCSYCIVTLARGEERSRPLDEVIAEANALHHSGIQEIVLAGVHLGGYGSDIGSSITELISTVLQQSQIPRLRIGSIEPWELDQSFWELFQSPRLMPHLHLPLQSGSDSVLRRMARRGGRDGFLQLLQEGRQRVADLNITTDIIAGFPGETEQEWQETLELVNTAGFGEVHLFPFSARQGTKAAMLPGQIEESIKRQRCQQLAELTAAQRPTLLQRHIGREVPVLIERGQAEVAEGRAQGYTPNFLRCIIDLPAGHPELTGQIYPIRIVRVEQDNHLWGQLAE